MSDNPTVLGSSPFTHGQLPLDLHTLATGIPLVCELPYDPKLADKGEAIAKTCKSIFDNATMTIVRAEPEVSRLLLVEFTHIIEAALTKKNDRALTQFNMNNLCSLAKHVFTLLPKDTPQTVVQDFVSLIDQLEEYNSLYTKREIKISYTGEVEDLNELTLELVDDLLSDIEQLRKELAEKYEFERGKTSCCDEIGYNPPASDLNPVHDMEVFERKSRQVGRLGFKEFAQLTDSELGKI